MIRKGTLEDIDSIIEITKACAVHMISKGIFQWNEFYPNPQAFIHDANRSELYVLEKDSNIVGCITLSIVMDAEYKPIRWLTPNLDNIYIHRLAVHPEYQGLGYAQNLMKFAEDYACNNNVNSIRLDTFSQNSKNQKFYELRGYKRLGNIYFPKQSEYPFYCYERIL
ncbi:GNAT family N-acetyltransferase [Changchengzhania lutea]|uniref:GNAT family N-acetyltransferase n=1 Tax=Changchengzhania lutea TaxID=2049305 RepID=UPI00115D52CF|nr:GNAT family N-acetyltransferase [Changchengzhania lutea]